MLVLFQGTALVGSIIHTNNCMYRFIDGELIYSLIVAKFHKPFVNNICEFNMTMCRCLHLFKGRQRSSPAKVFWRVCQAEQSRNFSRSYQRHESFQDMGGQLHARTLWWPGASTWGKEWKCICSFLFFFHSVCRWAACQKSTCEQTMKMKSFVLMWEQLL